MIATIQAQKTCSKCHQELPRDNFYLIPHISRQRSWCKGCHQLHRKSRAGRVKTPEQIIRSRQNWEEHSRRRKYGLLRAEFDQMVVSQGGRCLGCGKAAPLLVDHCHETGKVRGLLCRLCNTGMGMLGDDPGRLRQLADYLEGKTPK